MRSLLAPALVVLAVGAGCSNPPVEPLQLDGNVLTVYNGTPQDWMGVEIWLNTYYRETTPMIQSRGRFRAPLDVFVEGFGGRFDFHRAQIKDVRLTAKQRDGTPVEVILRLRESGLAGALGGMPANGRKQ
jgi:hypothetical protein